VRDRSFPKYELRSGQNVSQIVERKEQQKKVFRQALGNKLLPVEKKEQRSRKKVE